MLGLVEQAFLLIKDNLDDFERRGKYLFNVIECNNHDNISPLK
jgi:hypothetical protein